MDKKVLLMILDGWGIAQDKSVSAIDRAQTPFMDSLRDRYPYTTLEASGMAVGLPEGQMGNSEVGHMRARVVLLKRFTWEGFYFYTNYLSEKGRDIAACPSVCLSFFWDAFEREIIIEGVAEKAPADVSDGYFATRPRGSRLGAWASEQSQVVPSREYLDRRLEEFEKQFEGKDVPRPPHCGLYLVRPRVIEFWQGRPNRMHDRLRYTLQEDFSWKLERLAP